MASCTYDHFGVPTKEKHAGEFLIEAGGVYATSPDAHPFRVEFLRFNADSPMPEPVRTRSHAAFLVDNIEAAIKGYRVVAPPFDATPELRVAFIMDGEALIEVMQKRNRP